MSKGGRSHTKLNNKKENFIRSRRKVRFLSHLPNDTWMVKLFSKQLGIFQGKLLHSLKSRGLGRSRRLD